MGVFTAMLTVADDMTNMVYWIQQNLTVTVEENQLKLELDSLTQQFKQLSAKYDTLMSNYTTLSTKLENIFDRFGDGFGGKSAEASWPVYSSCISTQSIFVLMWNVGSMVIVGVVSVSVHRTSSLERTVMNVS